MLRKIKDRYDKNQRKKLNKGMTKKQGCLEKIEQRYDKNQSYLEKKLKVGVIKIKVVKKKLKIGMRKIEVAKKNLNKVMRKIKIDSF